MGTETFSTNTFINMIVVTVGVMIASYGEINFVVVGVMVQLASIASESTRLTLVQILLQVGLRTTINGPVRLNVQHSDPTIEFEANLGAFLWKESSFITSGSTDQKGRGR